MSDDVGTLERIYARADLEMTPRARQAIRRYIDEHPRGRHGRIVYDLAADFGIDWDGVYPDFQAYLDVFPVERERPNR